MAACLITITGTTGTLELRFKLSGVDKTIIFNESNLITVDDATVTDVTYTADGDMVATSGCLTITDEPATCRLWYWKDLDLENYEIDAVVVESTVTEITNVPIDSTITEIAETINSSTTYRTKVLGIKSDIVMDGIEAFPTSNETFIKIRVFGTDEPFLRLKELSSSSYLYVPSTSTTCDLTDYTEINECGGIITPP